MEPLQSQTLFLALTSLEEFWDKSQPMLFLGQWCQSYDKLSTKKNVILLDHPELVDRNPHPAYHYTFQLYEKLLPLIAHWLNQIHNTHHSIKYWRITIGSFLLLYIQVIYHRWNALKIATSNYPSLNTIGLATTSYLTPINTNEFGFLAAESDGWNHQLMTQILSAMNFTINSFQDYEWKNEFKKRELLFGQKTSYKKSTRIKLRLLQLIAKLRRTNLVGLYGPGGGLGTKEDLRKVMMLSKFRILPLIESRYSERAAIEKISLNRSIREEIPQLFVEDNFSRIVLETLKINFPINFIETYKEEVKISTRSFPFAPRVILGGWIFDDRLSLWAAQLSEKGSTLVSTQHGGAYGMLSLSSYEDLEKATSDVFISWGWKDKNKNVLPAPSVYICKRKEMQEKEKYKTNKKQIVLWLTTDIMRYTVHLTSIALSSHDYFNHQEAFLKQIESRILNQIIMRLRPFSTYQSYLKNRWKELNIQCPSDKESFFQQLGKAKIVVCDNINTTFLYALAFNIPTILFWDKNAWGVREEARCYFKKLQSVGIYHDSPCSAATMLNEIFDNPEQWWSNENLQSIRRSFCDNYAKMCPNWLDNWVKMLLDLSRTNRINDKEKNDYV